MGVVVLVALLVRLGGVLEEASVFDGDGLANLGNGTVALLVSSLGNTHDEELVWILVEKNLAMAVM